jgi:hypothetical protein
VVCQEAEELAVACAGAGSIAHRSLFPARVRGTGLWRHKSPEWAFLGLNRTRPSAQDGCEERRFASALETGRFRLRVSPSPKGSLPRLFVMCKNRRRFKSYFRNQTDGPEGTDTSTNWRTCKVKHRHALPASAVFSCGCRLVMTLDIPLEVIYPSGDFFKSV